MSTDDLTARLRNHLAHSCALTRGLAISLLREATDEVDRLGAALRETVAARNYAMRQRDEEARAKVGNIDALNTAITERNAAQAEVERLRAALSAVNTTVETRTVHECPLCGSPDDVAGELALLALDARSTLDRVRAVLDADEGSADVPPAVRLPKLVGAISRVLDSEPDDGRGTTHQETP